MRYLVGTFIFGAYKNDENLWYFKRNSSYGKGVVLRSFPNLDSFEICIEYP